MPKAELLASWVCPKGMPHRHRKPGIMLAIICICTALLLPVFLYFGKEWLWLPSAGVLLATGCCLFYRMQKQLPQQEVLVTSAKIITEKQTWILQDENRLLTAVERSSSGLVFRGRERVNGSSRKFTVKLQVPQQELHQGEIVYAYFRKQLPEQTAAGSISG